MALVNFFVSVGNRASVGLKRGKSPDDGAPREGDAPSSSHGEESVGLVGN